MKYLSWILLAPIVLVAAVFAAHNNASQILDFWPLPLKLDLPVYGIVLGATAIGFFAGVVVTWLAAGRSRRRARSQRRQASDLAKQVETLKQTPTVPAPPVSVGPKD